MSCPKHPKYTGMRLAKNSKECLECVKFYNEQRSAGKKEQRGVKKQIKEIKELQNKPAHNLVKDVFTERKESENNSVPTVSVNHYSFARPSLPGKPLYFYLNRTKAQYGDLIGEIISDDGSECCILVKTSQGSIPKWVPSKDVKYKESAEVEQ